jgi:hypothetical protein
MAEEFAATSNDAPVKQEADLFEGWSWKEIPDGRTIVIPPGRVMVTVGPVIIGAGASLIGDVVEL